MEFIRSDGLVDIAKLGLTLAEGKQLLAQVQQEVVAAQADNHAMLRPDCRSCGRRCHVKDWRAHRIATLFGEVRVRLPRFLCAGCGRTETGVSWPSHCRSTPEGTAAKPGVPGRAGYFPRLISDRGVGASHGF
jgi:hypothetical protein